MKKTIMMLLCVFGMFSLVGCEETYETWDQKKTYQIDDTVKLTLKGIVHNQKIEPTNQNGDYEYWYTDNKEEQLVDIQFYVENTTKKKIDIKDHVKAELDIDHNYSQVLCLETNHYSAIQNKTTLKAKEKAILHQIFYIKEKDVKDTIQAKFTFNENHYLLPIKQIDAKAHELEKDKLVKLDDMSIQPLSSFVSKVVPALHSNYTSSYYIIQDEQHTYVGTYYQITNLKKEALVLKEHIYGTLEVDGKVVDTWFDILNADGTNFTKETEIAPNDTRIVLVLAEVENPVDNKTYQMHLSIDGKPYRYQFQYPQV